MWDEASAVGLVCVTLAVAAGAPWTALSHSLAHPCMAPLGSCADRHAGGIRVPRSPPLGSNHSLLGASFRPKGAHKLRKAEPLELASTVDWHQHRRQRARAHTCGWLTRIAGGSRRMVAPPAPLARQRSDADQASPPCPLLGRPWDGSISPRCKICPLGAPARRQPAGARQSLISLGHCGGDATRQIAGTRHPQARAG